MHRANGLYSIVAILFFWCVWKVTMNDGWRRWIREWSFKLMLVLLIVAGCITAWRWIK